jgi:Ca2+-binding EF-hand superfamily protein
MPFRGLFALLALATAAAVVPAAAGEAVRSFAESDRNGDGSVDRREAERRALEVFSFADGDRDGHLSREEYDSLVLDDAFAAADTNHDGRVSTREFVAIRMQDFEAADRNHDGVLSPDEVR